MRRNFSLPRLAIVVAWAVLAPQSRWSELLPSALMPDAGPLPRGDNGQWNPMAWNFGSGTEQESYLCGQATLAQDEGHNDFNPAADTYFSRQRTGGVWQNQTLATLSPEAQVRIRNAAAPARLKDGQFDPLSGAIRWPAVLAKSEFDHPRRAVDRVWTERDGSPDQTRQIEAAVGQLEAALAAEIRAVAPFDYVAAQKFLTSLSYEAAQTPLKRTL